MSYVCLYINIKYFLLVKEKEKSIRTGFCFSQQGGKHVTINYPFTLVTQNGRKASLWIQFHLE